MPLKAILVDNPMNAADVARELVPPDIDLVIGEAGSREYEAALPGAQFVLGSSYPAPGFLDKEFYKRAPNLKLLQLLGVGYDKMDIELAREVGVPICNTGGAKSNAAAEHVMLLMLSVARRLIWQHNNVLAGEWRGNNGRNTDLYELRGRLLGVLGMGTIGTKVATLAKAFGMRVQYYDHKRLPEQTEDAMGVRFALFSELLRSSDYLTLHVPLNQSTKHLLKAPELAAMKPSAYLINASRGAVVDEAALYSALSNGTIAGAALDVFAEEPPRRDNPLFTLNNVVLSAHMACHTRDNQYVRFRNAFDNVQRVARGERPLWLIPEFENWPER